MGIKISILVPFWNVENYISKCAKSLFKQTLNDLEFIFVNDCSSDKSLYILEELISHQHPDIISNVKIQTLEKNSGVATARNVALSLSKGDYIFFVDSDDWIEPNCTELLYNKAVETNADVTCCDFFVEYKNQTEIKHNVYASSKEEIIGDAISQRHDIALWKILAKRDLYVKNEITFNRALSVGEDALACLQLYYFANKIVYIEEPLYHYVQYNYAHLSKINADNIKIWAKSIYQIEAFCKQHGIYEKYHHQISLRKFVAKKPLIQYKELRDMHEWRTLMPEVNNYWRFIPMGKREKILFFLAEKGYSLLFKIASKID